MRFAYFSSYSSKKSIRKKLDADFYSFIEHLKSGKVSRRDFEHICTVKLNQKPVRVYTVRAGRTKRIVCLVQDGAFVVINYGPDHDSAYDNSDGSLVSAQLKKDLIDFIAGKFETIVDDDLAHDDKEFSFDSIEGDVTFEQYLHSNPAQFMILDSDQSEIIEYDLQSPLGIYGPAGCGKSTVGLSWILNLLERFDDQSDRFSIPEQSVLKIGFLSPGEGVVQREAQQYAQQKIAQETNAIVEFIHIQPHQEAYTRSQIERWIGLEIKDAGVSLNPARIYQELMNLYTFGSLDRYLEHFRIPHAQQPDLDFLRKIYPDFESKIQEKGVEGVISAYTFSQYHYIVIDEAHNVPAHLLIELSKYCQHKILMIYDHLQAHEWMGIPNINIYKNFLFQKNIPFQERMLSTQYRNAPVIFHFSRYLSQLIEKVAAKSQSQWNISPRIMAQHSGELKFFHHMTDPDALACLDLIKNTNQAAIITSSHDYQEVCQRFPEHFVLTPQSAQGRDLTVVFIAGIPWLDLLTAPLKYWQYLLTSEEYSPKSPLIQEYPSVERGLRQFMMLVTRGIKGCWIAEQSLTTLKNQTPVRAQKVIWEHLKKSVADFGSQQESRFTFSQTCLTQWENEVKRLVQEGHSIEAKALYHHRLASAYPHETFESKYSQKCQSSPVTLFSVPSVSSASSDFEKEYKKKKAKTRSHEHVQLADESYLRIKKKLFTEKKIPNELKSLSEKYLHSLMFDRLAQEKQSFYEATMHQVHGYQKAFDMMLENSEIRQKINQIFFQRPIMRTTETLTYLLESQLQPFSWSFLEKLLDVECYSWTELLSVEQFHLLIQAPLVQQLFAQPKRVQWLNCVSFEELQHHTFACASLHHVSAPDRWKLWVLALPTITQETEQIIMNALQSLLDENQISEIAFLLQACEKVFFQENQYLVPKMAHHAALHIAKNLASLDQNQLVTYAEIFNYMDPECSHFSLTDRIEVIKVILQSPKDLIIGYIVAGGINALLRSIMEHVHFVHMMRVLPLTTFQHVFAAWMESLSLDFLQKVFQVLNTSGPFAILPKILEQETDRMTQLEMAWFLINVFKELEMNFCVHERSPVNGWSVFLLSMYSQNLSAINLAIKAIHPGLIASQIQNPKTQQTIWNAFVDFQNISALELVSNSLKNPIDLLIEDENGNDILRHCIIKGKITYLTVFLKIIKDRGLLSKALYSYDIARKKYPLMHFAIQNGNCDVIHVLLTMKPDLFFTNDHFPPAIYLAIQQDRLDIFSQLYHDLCDSESSKRQQYFQEYWIEPIWNRNQLMPPSQKTQGNQNTPLKLSSLHYMVYANALTILGFILSRPEDLHHHAKLIDSLMARAVSCGRQEVIQLFFQKYQDVIISKQICLKQTAFQMIMTGFDDVELLNFVFEKGRIPFFIDEHCNLLMLAVLQRHLKAVEVFINLAQRNPEVRQNIIEALKIPYSSGLNGSTEYLLMGAANFSYENTAWFDCVIALLRLDPSHVGIRSITTQVSVFMYALIMNHEYAIHEILSMTDRGEVSPYHLQIQDPETFQSPLEIALTNQQTSVACRIWEYVKNTERYQSKIAILYLAIINNAVEFVEKILLEFHFQSESLIEVFTKTCMLPSQTATILIMDQVYDQGAFPFKNYLMAMLRHQQEMIFAKILEKEPLTDDEIYHAWMTGLQHVPETALCINPSRQPAKNFPLSLNFLKKYGHALIKKAIQSNALVDFQFLLDKLAVDISLKKEILEQGYHNSSQLWMIALALEKYTLVKTLLREMRVIRSQVSKIKIAKIDEDDHELLYELTSSQENFLCRYLPEHIVALLEKSPFLIEALFSSGAICQKTSYQQSVIDWMIVNRKYDDFQYGLHVLPNHTLNQEFLGIQYQNEPILFTLINQLISEDHAHQQILQLILSMIECGFDIGARNADGQSVLFCAIESGETELIQKLIQRSSLEMINELDGKTGHTPLSFALDHHFTDIALYLIEHGAGCCIELKNENNILTLSAENPDVAVLNVILSQDSSQEFFLSQFGKIGDQLLNSLFQKNLDDHAFVILTHWPEDVFLCDFQVTQAEHLFQIAVFHECWKSASFIWDSLQKLNPAELSDQCMHFESSIYQKMMDTLMNGDQYALIQKIIAIQVPNEESLDLIATSQLFGAFFRKKCVEYTYQLYHRYVMHIGADHFEFGPDLRSRMKLYQDVNVFDFLVKLWCYERYRNQTETFFKNIQEDLIPFYIEFEDLNALNAVHEICLIIADPKYDIAQLIEPLICQKNSKNQKYFYGHHLWFTIWALEAVDFQWHQWTIEGDHLFLAAMKQGALSIANAIYCHDKQTQFWDLPNSSGMTARQWLMDSQYKDMTHGLILLFEETRMKNAQEKCQYRQAEKTLVDDVANWNDMIRKVILMLSQETDRESGSVAEPFMKIIGVLFNVSYSRKRGERDCSLLWNHSQVVTQLYSQIHFVESFYQGAMSVPDRELLWIHELSLSQALLKKITHSFLEKEDQSVNDRPHESLLIALTRITAYGVQTLKREEYHTLLIPQVRLDFFINETKTRSDLLYFLILLAQMDSAYALNEYGLLRNFLKWKENLQLGEHLKMPKLSDLYRDSLAKRFERLMIEAIEISEDHLFCVERSSRSHLRRQRTALFFTWWFAHHQRLIVLSNDEVRLLEKQIKMTWEMFCQLAKIENKTLSLVASQQKSPLLFSDQTQEGGVYSTIIGVKKNPKKGKKIEKS